MQIPRIAITLGEPAGIGPDLAVLAAQKPHNAQLIAVGSADLLKRRAAQLKQSIDLTPFQQQLPRSVNRKEQIFILDKTLQEIETPGILNTANSQYVLQTIEFAARNCLNGVFDAMVTAPVHKGIINDAGSNFSGHTEYIANIVGGHPVMMLATPGLRVALATTHIPLKMVSTVLTQQRLYGITRTLNNYLKSHFAISHPKILVCGLNPHAGENGHLGREEITTILPAIEKIREEEIDVAGPLPADTVFTPKYLQQADVVLAMYHDQGLPVLKYKGFSNAVNITLGLPIIRTSVDHGTALPLAGTGDIETGSLHYAVDTAITMINNHKRYVSHS